MLHEEGYESTEQPTRSHEPPVRSFERAKPNQLWQTDLFTFVLKRQNRRVYLVAFLDVTVHGVNCWKTKGFAKYKGRLLDHKWYVRLAKPLKIKEATP